MDFYTKLAEKRTAITRKWFDLVIGTYPPQTARLLTKESNQFANPLGHAISKGLQEVFDDFLQGLNPETVTPHLDQIIRIRAIQDFTPAQAIGFVFSLKRIVREEFQEELKQQISAADLMSFDNRVDQLAMIAFNLYSECRERLSETRINELKGRTFRLLQKAGLLAEVPEWEKPSKGKKHQ
jgi:hypothetical protein